MDRDLILLVTKGHSSSYSIWAFMKNNYKEKVMAYINVNKRVIRLSKMGFLVEVRPDPYVVNVHGRKDYTVTLRGMIQLIPHILSRPQEVKGLVEYMDKISIDKSRFSLSLLKGYLQAIESLNEYHKYTKLLYHPKDIVSKSELKGITDEYGRILDKLTLAMNTMTTDLIASRTEMGGIDAKTKSRLAEIEIKSQERRNRIFERERKRYQKGKS